MAAPIGFITPGQGPAPISTMGYNPAAPNTGSAPSGVPHIEVDLRSLLSGAFPGIQQCQEVGLRLTFADAAILQAVPASVQLPSVRLLRVSLDGHWVKCKAVVKQSFEKQKDKAKKYAEKAYKSKADKAAKRKKDKVYGKANPLHNVWLCLGRVLPNVQMVVVRLDCGCKLSSMVEMAGLVFPHSRHLVIDDWRSDSAGKSKDCYDEDDFMNARGLQSLTVQNRNALLKEKRLENLFEAVEKLPMLRSVNLVLASSPMGQQQFGYPNQGHTLQLQPQFGLPNHGNPHQPQFGHQNQPGYPVQPQFGLPGQGNPMQPQFGLPPNQINPLQPQFGVPHPQNPLQPQFGRAPGMQPQFGLPNQATQVHFGLPNQSSVHPEVQKLLSKSKLGQRVRIQMLSPQTFKADLQYLNSLEQGQLGHNILPQS